MKPTITELCNKAHEQAVKWGLYPEGEDVNFGEKVMLMVTGLSGAAEAYRDNRFSKMGEYEERIRNYEKYGVEDSETPIEEIKLDTATKRACYDIYIKNSVEATLARAILKICDFAKFKGIDLEKHILLEMEYNKYRTVKIRKIY